MRVKIPAGLFRSESLANSGDRWTRRKIVLRDGQLSIHYYGRWFEVRIPTLWAARRWPPHWVAVPRGLDPKAIISE